MRAIIPVAGLGTRLKPHTYSLPKVLINVAGKPILGHILDKLLTEHITKATFVVGHLGGQIRDFVSEFYPMVDAEYVIQKDMLGLGHAIYTAVPTFDDDELFIILGDTIFDVDLKQMFSGKNSSLGVKSVDDPSRFGVAITEGSQIVKLVEKPSTHVSKLALTGLYFVKNAQLLEDSLREIMERKIKTRGEYQLTDALQIMIDKGETFDAFSIDGWYDCGKPETLLATNKFLLSKKENGRNIEGVIINHPVFIAESAEVKNSIIGPNATIADNCKITDCNIKNSIINTGSHIEGVMLENSIIGGNTLVKGNFKRLNAGDSSEIELY